MMKFTNSLEPTEKWELARIIRKTRLLHPENTQ
jgi:hypothetical protein